jgi:hypothetical protein
VDLEALAAAKGPVALEPIPAEAAWGPAPLGGPWDWSALMGAGGAATAVALLAWAEQQHPGAPCFALAVGPAVRAGLPTAARAHVAARAPLTGRLSEGLVGGELGLRLASFADGLLLTGRIPARDRVLRLLAPADGAGPRAVLAELPVRDGSRTSDILDAARSLAGPGALLAAGPAADRGVRFANLANESDPPSFVGRGGLGLALAELGVKAVHVGAEPVAAAGDPEWTTRLARSPRLIQRGAQGSIELFEALAARGVAASVGAARDDMQRHRGCRGCPTPCGWVFERGERPAAGAHFAALAPFGELLDLRDEGERARLARAGHRRRRVGLRVGDRTLGPRERGGTRRGRPWRRRPGERAGRAAARPLGARRADPTLGRAHQRRRVGSDAQLSVPGGRHGQRPGPRVAQFLGVRAERLGSEQLRSQAAALGLARTRGGGRGHRRLLRLLRVALGDAVCRARGLLDTGREPLPGDDPELEAAWMAYGAWCASGALLEGGAQPVRADAAEQSSALPESVPGRLRVHSSGPLGVALGELEALDLPLPATLDDVLAELVRRRPAARPFLAGAGGSAAAAHVSRAGRSRRLVPGEPLLDGDELWLVVALPGG